MNRRKFLQVVGVSGAGTAALSGCSTAKVEKLVPYLVQSEDQVPGIPTIYASTCTECATGCGLHVTTREARAIKLEGNPEPPGEPRHALRSRPGRAAGALQPRPRQGADGPHRHRRLPGDHLGRGDQRGWPTSSRGPRASWRCSAARGRAPSPTCWRDGRPRWAARWPAGSPSTTRRCGRPTARSSASTSCRLTTSPGRSSSCPSAPTSSRAGCPRSRTSAVSPSRARLRQRRDGQVRVRRAAAVAHRPERRRVAPDQRPAAEAALALAMANVILSERTAAPADANALRGQLAAWTPEKAAEATGLTAQAITRLAREFASAKPGLAVAGGIASQHRGAIEVCAAVNILNYVAGNVGRDGPVRRQDLQAGDGYPGDHRPPGRHGRRSGGGPRGPRGQPGLRPAEVRPVRRGDGQGAVQGVDVALSWTRPPRPATCSCPTITRSSAGMTSAPRPGRARPDAAGHGAGLHDHGHRRPAAQGCEESGRSAVTLTPSIRTSRRT